MCLQASCISLMWLAGRWIPHPLTKTLLMGLSFDVHSPPLSKVTPHGSTHMYYTVDLIEHPNSEANLAKINCNYILVVSENAFMSRKWLLD